MPMLRAQNKDYMVLKIVIQGEKNVGSTTFFERFCNGIAFIRSIKAIGVDFSIKNCTSYNQVSFNFWHVSSEPRFNSIPEFYYSSAQGGIFLFDITNRESFEKVGHYIENILKYNNNHLSLALLGTKSDLRSYMPGVTDEEAAAYCEQLKEISGRDDFEIKYFPVSSATELNIDNCFTYLAEDFLMHSSSIEKIRNIFKNNKLSQTIQEVVH